MTTRERVLAAVDAACAVGVAGVDSPPLTRGPDMVRRGRWIICNTSHPTALVAVEVTRDGAGAAAYLGPPSVLRAVVPRAVRLAWIAEQYGESDDDPAD